MRKCLLEECDEKHRSNGYCNKHFQRWRKYGDPNHTRFALQTDTHKYCGVCEKMRPLEDYALSGKGVTGKQAYKKYCKLCFNLWMQAYKYGLTVDQLKAVKSKNDGKCEICDEVPTVPHIDHDHSCCPGDRACGKCVRGILCSRCNQGIGLLRENTVYLLAAIEYLNRTGVKSDRK